KDGHLIKNIDDPNAHNIINTTNANVVSFGINNDCDYKAENITYDEEGYPRFVLNIRNKEFYDIQLSVMGKHYLYNSLAAIASTHTLGMDMNSIAKNITLYKGVHRRLEVLG